MTSIGHILEAALAWTWRTSLSATVLIGMVLMLTILFGRWLPPRWRYALWLLVALRLMIPAVPSSAFSIFNLKDAAERLFSQPATLHSAPTLALDRRPTEGDPIPVNIPRKDAPLSVAHSEGVEIPRSFLITALPWLWLVGVAGYPGVILVQHRRLASWARRQTPVADSRLMGFLQSGKALLGLKQSVRMLATNCLRTPAVFGLHRPCLLLPTAMIEGLSDQELRLVILHELVHVKRRDVLLNWLLVFVQSLHWFNPAVWLALKRLRAERELVCDASVLSHLAPSEHPQYGAALIKVLDYVSKPSDAPGLVPIINRKHEIHRRISMITQFKPVPRLVTVISAALLLAIAGFTFTGAAEKEPVKSAGTNAAPKELRRKPAAAPGAKSGREMAARRIKILEDEWDRMNDTVRRKQSQLDDLQANLVIPSNVAEGQGNSSGLDPDILRRREAAHIEGQAEYEAINTLYSALTNLTSIELKKSLMTAVPDAQLGALVEQRALTEQKMADAQDTHTASHPEVKRLLSVYKQINQQVEDRLDGIMQGLRVKRAASKIKLEQLGRELERARRTDIEIAIQRRPYFQLKRELEVYQQLRERLQMRLEEEKVENLLAPDF